METPENIEGEKPDVKPASKRIVSVDALRGFDMFWIVGGQEVICAIIMLFGVGSQNLLLPQFEHTEWAGFTFWDLIFPLFIFMVGMSTVFSLNKIVIREGKWAAYKRIIRRFFLLYLMGIIYYGGFLNKWPEIRMVGVLQQIAISYLFASIIFINFKLRGMIITCVSILLGYWALLSFVPVPDLGKISFTEGANWANYLDKYFLIGKKYYGGGEWDACGILSEISSISTCLLGVFAGLLIRNKSIGDKRKVTYLLGAGIIAVVFGFLWGLQMPVIKKIWSPSYVMITAGFSCILLGIFYQIVDVWKIQKWTRPFIWIGMNPITIYMAWKLIDFNNIADRFVGGNVHAIVGDRLGNLLHALTALALGLLLLRYLYQKKIFLKV